MTIFTPNERLDYSAETRDSSDTDPTPRGFQVGSGSRLGGNPGNTPVDS
ncbi:hypothetical protein [Mobiluncus mulieris]|nr:hypothetical protein [Mobiluncus mulieris]